MNARSATKTSPTIEAAFEAIAHGWTVGRVAEPLLIQDWGALLDRNVEEVRAELGLIVPRGEAAGGTWADGEWAP